MEKRPGASGNLGVQQAATVPPDGYTLVIPITSFPINPTLYKLNSDTINDFASVILASIPPLILFVHTDVPAKNVSELIELTKSKSPQINFANSGKGTTAHLTGQLFNRMVGTQMSSINYRGGGPAVTDLLGGHVQVYFLTIHSVLALIEAGKLRELAVSGKNRIAELLNIPKVAEAGVTVFEVNAWLGVFAPSRTPRPIIDRLSGELGAILLKPEVRQRIMQQSMQADGGSPQSLREFLAIEIQGKLIREVGIRSD